ncbi:MAG: hypothetical protein RR937_04730 [Ruthenibacterium sp.]
MDKKTDLFTTVMRGFDKEEVLLYLNELVEMCATEKAKLQAELEEAKQKLDAAQKEPAGPTQDVQALNAEKENLQGQLQRLMESGQKLTQYLHNYKKEITRLRAENAQMQQAILDRQPDAPENGAPHAVANESDVEAEQRFAREQTQKILDEAQQEYDRVVDAAQKQADVIAAQTAAAQKKAQQQCDSMLAQAQAQADALAAQAQAQADALAAQAQAQADALAVQTKAQADALIAHTAAAVQEKAQQEYARIVTQAQVQAQAIATQTAEEQAKEREILLAQKQKAELEMQQMIGKVSACKAFLQQTNNAITQLYHQWE